MLVAVLSLTTIIMRTTSRNGSFSPLENSRSTPEPRSRIFLLGAAGEQEENGLGASGSGPARPLTQNAPLGSRVVSQKVNFLGQGNKGGSSRLPLGEERANILLLACCYQEGSNPGRKPGKGGPATSRFKVQGLRSSETSPKKMVKSKSKP